MNKKMLSVVAVILLGIGGYIVITGNYGVEDSVSKSPVPIGKDLLVKFVGKSEKENENFVKVLNDIDAMDGVELFKDPNSLMVNKINDVIPEEKNIVQYEPENDLYYSENNLVGKTIEKDDETMIDLKLAQKLFPNVKTEDIIGKSINVPVTLMNPVTGKEDKVYTETLKIVGIYDVKDYASPIVISQPLYTSLVSSFKTFSNDYSYNDYAQVQIVINEPASKEAIMKILDDANIAYTGVE